MYKKRRVWTGVSALILIVGLMAGCGAKMEAGDKAPQMTMSTTTAGSNVSLSFSEEMNSIGKDGYKVQFNEDSGKVGDYSGETVMAESPEMDSTGIRATGYASTEASLDILAQRKIIRNANLSLEVEDFYHSYGNLQAMMTGIGFVQESNIHRDYYYFEEERRTRVSGNITLRVDARHFDSVLNDIKGLGDIIDDRIYSTDVTDQFFDTEGRLKILKIEYNYLEEYMQSLKDPDSIFKTRMRMTELQTEIERLTGTLNKWSDLVELSTIYIQMTEKYPEEMNVKKTYTYGDRVKDSLKNSLTGIVEAIGDLVIFIIEAIPVLVILFILGWGGYKIFKKRKNGKKVSVTEAVQEKNKEE